MTKMAPGITIHSVVEVPLSEPALQTQTSESTYLTTFLDPVDGEELQGRIDSLLAAESHFRQRSRGKKQKVYDLRPLILDLWLDESADGAARINMRLFLMPGKTGRPDEVLLALDLDPLAARIRRARITLAHDGGG